MTPRRVFTLDAIATCEQRGHRMRWAHFWGGLGFDECERCGATGELRPRAGFDSAPSPEVEKLGVAPGVETIDLASTRAGRAQRHELQGAAIFARAMRDKAILIRVADGERVADIAKHFGLHFTSVYQIIRRGKAAAASGESP